MQNTAERFRFQSLQSRFSSFCELWDRTLRAREEGRADRLKTGRSAPGAPSSSPATPSAAPPTPGSDTGDRIVAEASVRDLGTDADRVRQLYQQLVDARKVVGEQPVPFERFERLVATQLAKLGADGKPVAFRVTLKDGKVSLTAKSAKGR
jgi:hypothetical protein